MIAHIRKNGALLVWSIADNDFILTNNLQHDLLFFSVLGRPEFTHFQLDDHVNDATIHFTEGSINHLNIQNIGTNTHSQIDTHISLVNEHFPTEPGTANHIALYKSDGAAIVSDSASKFYQDANDVLFHGTDLTEISLNAFAVPESVEKSFGFNTNKLFAMSRFSNDADGPELVLFKSRGTESVPLVSQLGDSLGKLHFAQQGGLPTVPAALTVGSASIEGVVTSTIGGVFAHKTGMEFYVSTGVTRTKICEMFEDDGVFGRHTKFYGGFIADNIEFLGYFQESITDYDTSTAYELVIGQRSVAHNNNSASSVILRTHVSSLDTALNTGHQTIAYSNSSAPDLNIDISTAGYAAGGGVAVVNGKTVAGGIYLSEPHTSATLTKITNVTDDTIDRYHLTKTAGIYETTFKTASFTIDNSMGDIEVDASGGDVDITLPTASVRIDHRAWTVQRTDDSTNIVRFIGTINGIVNPTFAFQYDSVTIRCNGTAFRFK